jgi:hypothetical protein
MTALRERFPHQIDERNRSGDVVEDLEFVTKRMDNFLASDHEPQTQSRFLSSVSSSVFRFQLLVRRPCPNRIFFASSVIPGGAGLMVFANA